MMWGIVNQYNPSVIAIVFNICSIFYPLQFLMSLQIDPYDYLKKNYDMFKSDFYTSPQFTSIVDRLIDLFFSKDGYFNQNNDEIIVKNGGNNMPSKQKFIVDLLGPHGPIFEQLLKQHISMSTEARNAAPIFQNQNHFFDIFEQRSVYTSSQLGKFINKMTECQNYCRVSPTSDNYYLNVNNAYLILLISYLQQIEGFLASQKQLIDKNIFFTSIIIQAQRVNNKKQVVIPVKSLLNYLQLKCLMNAFLNLKEVDYSTCICQQLKNFEFEEEYENLDKTVSDQKLRRRCHIDSMRSMQLLTCQQVIQSFSENDVYLHNFAATCLYVSLANYQHTLKLAIIYNLLICINKLNSVILNSFIQQQCQFIFYLLEKVKECYFTNQQQLTSKQQREAQLNYGKTPTLKILVLDQINTFLKQYDQFLLDQHQITQTNQIYIDFISVLLKQNVQQKMFIPQQHNQKLQREIVTELQNVQSAFLFFKNTTLNYNDDFLSVGDTQLLVEQLVNNCEYFTKQIIIDVYGERRNYTRQIEKQQTNSQKINLFNIITVDYQLLNKVFNVKTKLEVTKQKIEGLDYLVKLEQSGIKINLKDEKQENEEIFVLKQIVKSGNFYLILGFIIFLAIFSKQMMKWLMN